MYRAVWLIGLLACAEEPRAGTVTITGSVRPPASIDVVFRGATREEIARSGTDGKYRLEIPPGTYRVFVRGEGVMSIGRMDRVRVPGLPLAAAAGAVDEALAPKIEVTRDADEIDVSVVRGGTVTGTVFDFDARPVFAAVISAHANGQNQPRPTLGTDVAISRYDGTFELFLPDGDYRLAASHKSYADATDIGGVEVKGGSQHISLTLVKGCIITGRVIGHDGKPVGEGAIEKRFGATDLEFVPNGRIDSDGKFRWTTTDELDVVLRAWPWHRPPAPSKRFACKDGATFSTTFTVPDRAPDMTGTLVDKDGAAVPFTHLDVQPLDPGGIAQVERTDEKGQWSVFNMPAGRYAVTAVARGGVVQKIVTSPSTNVELALGGTGKIEGVTTLLANGTFELAFGACLDGTSIQLPRDMRLVTVTNGRFVVENAPACDLQLAIEWRGETQSPRVVVPARGTARLELDIGPPREKIVTGIVRDRNGDRVNRAQVTALYKKSSNTSVTDEDGRFTIATYAGATISASEGSARGETTVGLANVPRERVEIVLVNRR